MAKKGEGLIPLLIGGGVLAYLLWKGRRQYDSFLGVYHFQSESLSPTILDDGADRAKAMGFKIIRVGLSPLPYYNQRDFDADFRLVKDASSPAYASVFSKFDVILFTAYDGASFPLQYAKKYLDIEFMSNPVNQANIEQEYFELAQYLYETYHLQDKTFILLNWEGDHDVYCGEAYRYAVDEEIRRWCDGLYEQGAYGSSRTPLDSINAMRQWMMARQRGITRARVWAKGQGIENVQVYNGVEFNIVHVLRTNGYSSLLFDLIPDSGLDYYSYAAYESINTVDPYANLITDINSIRTFTQSNRLIVGEYAYRDFDPERLDQVIQAIQKGRVHYGIYWQLIDTPGYRSGLYDLNLDPKPVQSYFEEKLYKKS